MLYIRPSCQDCGSKIKINNHIEYEDTFKLYPGLTDFGYSIRGGTVQANDSTISFKINGSINQIIQLPQIGKESCQKIAMSHGEKY